MHIVAIHNIQNTTPKDISNLANALGITAYEARPRVQIVSKGPAIVKVFAEPEPALRLAKQLESAHFSTVVLHDYEIEHESSLEVRSFSLEEQFVRVESRQGQKQLIDNADVTLIIRGHQSTVNTQTTIKKGKKFSMGKAVMTGGLMLTKKTTTVQKTTRQTSGGFLYLYAKNHPVAIFREQALLYESLGDQMQPSRPANFTLLTNLLRQRCTTAKYDQRLLQKAAQKQLLGSSLDPEEHLHIAISLLAKSLLF